MKNQDQDHELNSFFKDAKQQDKANLEIPTFGLPSKQPRRLNKVMFIASIAASFAAIIIVKQVLFQDPIAIEVAPITITLAHHTQSTDILLDSSESIFEWTASTDTLIQEFDD